MQPRAPQWSVTLGVLAAAFAAAAEEPELTLAVAVRQALEANLDLASQRRALEANGEDVEIKRSPLLPQVAFQAGAKLMDDLRADGVRGNTPERSVTVAAGLSQVLYDESDWAGFQVQKHLYDEQRQDFESFRLGIVEDAAGAYLELDRWLGLTNVQVKNRALTEQSLETTRARVSAGYSAQRELLRWQSQLAANGQSVVQARTNALVSRFELNRVRNRPREEAVAPRPASVEDHGFVYSSELVAPRVGDPVHDPLTSEPCVDCLLSSLPQLVQSPCSSLRVGPQGFLYWLSYRW